jgi:hypothetical protein
MVVPWAFGFAAYQVVYPGGIGWWVTAWHWVASHLHLAPPTWMSASVTAFVVSSALTLPIAAVDRRRSQPRVSA